MNDDLTRQTLRHPKMPGPAVLHPGPTRSLAAYWLGRAWMHAFGWGIAGQAPPVPQAILIAAPHTSNWDLAHMLAASYVFRLNISWLGKHTLFRPPFHRFMRFLGGRPVDRRAPHGLVKQVIELFRTEPRLMLAVPPEGTRGYADRWKSGFYWMAYEAQVPIVCGFLDYRTRTAGLGYCFVPTGDITADMDVVRKFYASIIGKFPENASVICLREEQVAAAAAAGA